MKRKMIAMIGVMLFLTGCSKSEDPSTLTHSESSDNSVIIRQETNPSKTLKPAEDKAIPGSYAVPDGWVKSEEHSTDTQIFYIEEGHENDEKPDNIAINVGKNKYSLDEHEQFRDAIVRQLLKQMEGIKAELNGDGTYTEQGDLLYIFTIDEGEIVTTQYYIVKDYGFCLIQLTNFSGSAITDEAVRSMVDSFVWDDERE